MISAPFDLGGERFGSRLGPEAVRLSGIDTILRDLNYEFIDHGDVRIDQSAKGATGFGAVLPYICALREEVEAILNRQNFPLALCGEHTLAIGGIAAALNLFRRDLFVLWIDAHADINTPNTSATQHMHGMPLAALQRIVDPIASMGNHGWGQLIDCLGDQQLSPQKTVWFGLRDVDRPERDRVKQGYAVTMHEIDRFGIEQSVLKLDRHLRSEGCKHLWISFDVDVLDPILAPGTGTAVRGGLSYREAHLLAEMLCELTSNPQCPYRLAGLDIVEVNPLADTNNQTALLATEWVASLLGKTIL